MRQLAKETSIYQEITICESSELYGKTGRYRYLQFAENAVQGAMDLKNPERIVLEYPRAIIHLMDYNAPQFERAFIIGHGIGTIAGHYSNKSITVAEMDAKVVELSREYFHYRKDNVKIGDGRDLLEREKDCEYDYIIVDAFTAAGTPYPLTTLEFFKTTSAKLRPDGAIILNLTGRPTNDHVVSAIYATLGEVYTYCNAFWLPGESRADIGNLLVVGSSRRMDYEQSSMAGFLKLDLEQGHIIMDK